MFAQLLEMPATNGILSAYCTWLLAKFCIYVIWCPCSEALGTLNVQSANLLINLSPQQAEDTLWWQYCVLRCCPSVAKHGNVVVCHVDIRNVSEDFQKQDTKSVYPNKCCACGKTSQHLGNMIMAAMFSPQCVLVFPAPKMNLPVDI